MATSCSTCPSQGTCTKNEDQCGIENNPLNTIQKVIGVMSGKGGVGKSSMSVLIAKDLVRRGFKVGVLDADITGPSIPRLLQLESQRAFSDGTHIIPIESKEGIKVMSLNFLIDEETQPVVWRGPVIAGVIKQFWNEVLWGALDYLIIDMPPGTGDVPLTVGQSIPVSGMVMVSVPQDFIGMIVAKSVHMVEKLNVPIIGMIGNMSYIQCPDCDKQIRFFEDDVATAAKELNIPLLGEIPMLKGISNLSKATHDQLVSETYIAPIVDHILSRL